MGEIRVKVFPGLGKMPFYGKRWPKIFFRPVYADDFIKGSARKTSYICQNLTRCPFAKRRFIPC